MQLKLQKFAPIDREFPIYEIVDEKDAVILDISLSDEGVLELGVPGNRPSAVVPLDDVLKLIHEARELLQAESLPS